MCVCLEHSMAPVSLFWNTNTLFWVILFTTTTKLSSFPKVLNCRMFYFLLEICDEVFLIFKISSSSSLSSQVFCLFSRLNMVLISALLMKKVKQPSTSLQERGATKS